MSMTSWPSGPNTPVTHLPTSSTRNFASSTKAQSPPSSESTYNEKTERSSSTKSATSRKWLNASESKHHRRLLLHWSIHSLSSNQPQMTKEPIQHFTRK